MSGTIDHRHSTRSVYAYFGAKRIAALARLAGRRLVHKPIDLSRVIPASGSLAFERRPPATRVSSSAARSSAGASSWTSRR